MSVFKRSRRSRSDSDCQERPSPGQISSACLLRPLCLRVPICRRKPEGYLLSSSFLPAIHIPITTSILLNMKFNNHISCVLSVPTILAANSPSADKVERMNYYREYQANGDLIGRPPGPGIHPPPPGGGGRLRGAALVAELRRDRHVRALGIPKDASPNEQNTYNTTISNRQYDDNREERKTPRRHVFSPRKGARFALSLGCVYPRARDALRAEKSGRRCASVYDAGMTSFKTQAPNNDNSITT